MRRPGLQSEFVLGLGLVMLAATVTLAAILLHYNDQRLRDTLGAALLVEGQHLERRRASVIPGTLWWRVLRDGSARPAVGLAAESIDPKTAELAEEARRLDQPLLLPGAAWAEIRFALPLGTHGDVVVAKLPRSASLRLRGTPLLLTGIFLTIDVLIFTAFGAIQMRRRVVLPMQRMVGASESIALGSFAVALPVDGPREVAALAQAMNEMSAALETRTEELEKAIVELRESNRALRDARIGLDRAERMASVGRLAAGVAHEVGNPMGALLAYLDLARRDPQSADATRNHLDRASDQGERIRRILRQLLDYSKPPRPERGPIDFEALAREAVELAETQTRLGDVTFSVSAPEALPAVLGDAGMVAQILLNLVINGADATMSLPPEADDGADDAQGRPQQLVSLVLSASILGTREGETRSEALGHRGPDAVACLIADNGCGIAPEDEERIFDPFFTTKAPGDGTGLGLANAARLCEELGGVLELADASELPPNCVTGFRLVLPAHCEDECGVRKTLRS